MSASTTAAIRAKKRGCLYTTPPEKVPRRPAMRPTFPRLLIHPAIEKANVAIRPWYHRSDGTTTGRARPHGRHLLTSNTAAQPLAKSTSVELEMSFEATASLQLELIMRQQGFLLTTLVRKPRQREGD